MSCVVHISELITFVCSLTYVPSAHVTMGAPGDSFFEYLIKFWLMTGKQDTPSAEMYFKAIQGFEERLLKTTNDGLKYFAQQTGDDEPIHKMDHLVRLNFQCTRVNCC